MRFKPRSEKTPFVILQLAISGYCFVFGLMSTGADRQFAVTMGIVTGIISLIWASYGTIDWSDWTRLKTGWSTFRQRPDSAVDAMQGETSSEGNEQAEVSATSSSDDNARSTSTDAK